MKKLTMIVVSAVSLASLVTTTATSQASTDATYASNIPLVKNPANTARGRYNLEDNQANVKELEANLKTAKVNLKLRNHLSQHFTSLSGLRFHDEKNFIIARFNSGEKSSRVVYDEKGNWLYSVTTYAADLLPDNIRTLVNRSYGKYTITLVQEVSQGEVNLHKIFLEDAKTLKHILVSNDEIFEYADFKKGN